MKSLAVFHHPAIRVVAGIGLFLASTLAVIDSISISRLRAEVRPQRAEVAALDTKLAELKHQLSDLAQQPSAVSETRFLASQHATDERIARIEDILTGAARREELADWQERLAAVEARLTKLRQGERVIAVHPRAIPEVTISARRTEPEIPFRILGTEMRGGEPFLSLMPLGASSLADVRVLRVGERLGDWQLTKLDSQAADFVIDGHTRRMELPQQVQ